ncbi:hypothetical protein AAVH_20199 [Aphelenchoides avenae]|nr:hypothetical protein AAVH_20199 [Aphelenchus avenae]
MAIEAEVLSTLKDFEKRYKAEMKKGDTRKFVSTFYHPHAVCVHGGGAGVAYGHEGITKFYGGDQATKCEKEEAAKGEKDEAAACGMQECNMETSYESYDKAGNGEYLFLKSLTWEKKSPEQKCFCEQIFKRTDGGGYVIYHEEFGMCGGGCGPNAGKDVQA